MFETLGRKSALQFEALNAIQAKVMVADRQLTITFMNQAVIDLLKDA